MAWINVDAGSKLPHFYAGRDSTAASRARTFANASVYSEARWGRAWQGRCRMKSRSDTTLAHSIITKPRDSSATSTLLFSLSPFTHYRSLRCVYVRTKELTPWWINTNLQSTLNPGLDSTDPSLPSLYLSASRSLSLCYIHSSSRRPCSPAWLRSIHRPSSEHIGGVLPAHRSGKCKMDVLRSRWSDSTPAV